MNTSKKLHCIGLIMLCAVALFWGAGFVLNAQLMDRTFYDTPALLNSLRFVISSLCMLAIFNKRLRFNRQILLYGGIGGALLFVGFFAQLVGIKYTSPSHSGFFTAFYVVLTPFFAWAVYRKRPHWIVFAAGAMAIGGLLLLNLAGTDRAGSWKGDLITFGSAVSFALQIVLADYALKRNKTDYVQLTFWQVTFAALLFVLYSAIFESKHYSALHFDVHYNLWRLAIVVLGGTAFAYYAQTFAQVHLNPSETSIIMACESPIGAFLSMVLAIEPFLWQTVVGGFLVIAAVVLVELVPNLHRRCKPKNADVTAEQVGTTSANADDPPYSADGHPSDDA